MRNSKRNNEEQKVDIQGQLSREKSLDVSKSFEDVEQTGRTNGQINYFYDPLSTARNLNRNDQM
jgi:hypothetical protein